MKQQTSLQTFNQPHLDMARQLNRPSPSHSATSFAVGTQAVGNDGRWWKVSANSAGVQRWVPDPKAGQSRHNYKFNVGDKVKVIDHGSGVGSNDMGVVVTIVEQGDYAGHIEILSRTKLKRLINRLSVEGEVINAKEALEAPITNSSNVFTNSNDISPIIPL